MSEEFHQGTFFTPTESITSPGRLVFRLTIPGRLPSWNDMLAMEHWERYLYKREVADAFLSELRRIAESCSTKTTSARNSWLTYADTLERYLAMRQEKRRLRLLKRRLAAKNQKELSLKSSSDDVPF